jgi:hypothetical protein
MMEVTQEAMQAALEAAARAVFDWLGMWSEDDAEADAADAVAHAAITAYLTSLEKAGFVLVPVTPTEDMMTRGKRQPNDLRLVWLAMVRAAMIRAIDPNQFAGETP